MTETINDQTILTPNDIAAAVMNDHGEACFSIGGRLFPIKDLDYESYIAFCRVAKPIIEVTASALEVKASETGAPDISFNPLGLDWDVVLSLAEKELPQMVWICLKQSDPKITVKDVKKLLPRPQLMLEIVLLQIKHNDLIKEFADFFPRMMGALTLLIPQAAEAVATVPMESTTEETLS